MKSLLILLCSMVALLSVNAYSQTNDFNFKSTDYFDIIANSDIESTLISENSKTNISGRVSMNLKVNETDISKNRITVASLNLAFFRVDQNLLTKEMKPEDKLGVLGFSTTNSKTQYLKINKERNVIEGELIMYMDASILNSLAVDEKVDLDFIETPTIPVQGQIQIKLEKQLSPSKNEINQMNGIVQFELKSRPTKINGIDFPSKQLQFTEQFKFDIADLVVFETVKSLCIQPVFITTFTVNANRWGTPFFTVHQTGEGLNFGRPQLEREWRKADVVFNIREPKYIFASQYYISTADEAADLKDLVDDDDCIEVFFVNDFDPVDTFGGGAAWGSGTASAKVVSSDGNARGGVDLTHLAHEFGHVLGIRHPWSPATANASPGSFGTLMCGSGYLNDNPQINSEENKNLVSNPLLVTRFQPRSSLNPDCNNSTDCGPTCGSDPDADRISDIMTDLDRKEKE